MVLASEIQQKQRNYTGLTAAELVIVLAEKEAELTHHNQIIQRHKNTIRRHTNTIKNRDHYIRLLEERLRLSKVQRFGANSEKLAFQIDLFDEAELEQAIVDIDNQLPDELLP